MNKILFLSACLLFFFTATRSQTTEVKKFYKKYAGDAECLSTYGELKAGWSNRVYKVYVNTTSAYRFSALVNLTTAEKLIVTIDDIYWGNIIPATNGWQIAGANLPLKTISYGYHEIAIKGISTLVPMIEEIALNKSLTRSPDASLQEQFIQQVQALKARPVIKLPGADEIGDITNKVLPNPAGSYNHAVDTPFNYTHFAWIYLPVGNYTFTTSGSTINRALTLFNPDDYNYSWSNVNGGPGGESGLYLYVGKAGYYAIMLRPVNDGETGTTNILMNGSVITYNAVIGGKRFAMGSLKGGPMNFFTCKLSPATADTRIIVSRYAMSSTRVYNDDYSGGNGNWNWAYSSRTKKDFATNDSVQYAFVCAYSPASTGICDVYLGNGNSNLPVNEPQNFPGLPTDDAIESGDQSVSYYNCAAWAGGVTSTWIWPPSSYSTYNCNSGNVLLCFDNYLGNNPVRYPGAWNYTRTGATSANSVVDLWKTASAYTHVSVKEPGNNHPHGYDWESKPGGLDRTFHPRNALNNPNWYGAVSNYYIPTGTYARGAGVQQAFTTDADAIKAGAAIYDKAELTRPAKDKLSALVAKVSPAVKNMFEELYRAWDATKEAHASLSDPAMYCKNREHAALEKLAARSPQEVLVLVMDKFVNNNDHFIGELMWTLSHAKYAALMEEVRAERLASPNDAAGRYRIHGDHDNGVLYVEKILKDFELTEVTRMVSDPVTVTVSPNPVREVLQIKLFLEEARTVTIKVLSAQTLRTRVVNQEAKLSAGMHQFVVPIEGLAGHSGDLLSVQIQAGDEVKTIKVLVGK